MVPHKGSPYLPAYIFLCLSHNALGALQGFLMSCLELSTQHHLTYSQYLESPELLHSPELTLPQPCFCNDHSVMQDSIYLGAFAFNFSNHVIR